MMNGSRWHGVWRMAPPIAVVLALSTAVAVAAPGDLDTSFDGDGKQTVEHGGSDQATDVLVQPDGKIFLAGQGTLAEDFIVSRLNPNGSLDTSFDVDGRNYVGLPGGGRQTATAAALQADGKIVVAGETYPDPQGQSDVLVMRFNADGSLDNAFHPGGPEGAGIRVIDYAYFDSAQDVLIQPDGKIVVAGDGGPGSHLAIARMNPDGTADTSFDLDGQIGIDFGSFFDGAAAAALQADGKIVVVGHTYAQPNGPFDVAVARLNGNGSLDTSFDPGGPDGAGKKTIDYGGNDFGNDVLVQPDGKIVLVGAGNPDGDFAVTRLNPDGSYDGSFDFDGTIGIDFGPGDGAQAAALQANGKIVVAGYTTAAGIADDPAITRLQPGGSLDTTFSSDGKLTLPIPYFALASGVALQADGKIVIGGGAEDGAGAGNINMLAARFDGDSAASGGGPGRTPGGGGSGGGERGKTVPTCAGKRATIVGTARRDRLRGTRRSDVIVSLAGNDRIKGGKGNDRICAGTGNDRAAGGAGNDRLYGQGGKDKVSGGGGKDRMNGGAGRDRCNGGPGKDRGSCERERSI